MGSQYKIGKFTLDKSERRITRNGKIVHLQPKSFDVLVYLVEHAGLLVSKEAVLSAVWADTIVTENSLAVCIRQIRALLEDSAEAPQFIETIAGSGYRFIGDCIAVVEPTENSHHRQYRLVMVLVLLALLGWAGYSFYSENVRSTSFAAVEPTSTMITLAVLPFVNMSSDAEQEYFVDGLTEEVINSLARIEGLLVTGRTSSFVFKNKNRDLRQIGIALGVNYLLEGSVRKSGHQIRIAVQLIDASTGTHVFSEVFSRKLVDVFAIQKEISNQVAAALKISLIHKDNQYNAAIMRLDTIAIEQLFTARAQIDRYDGRHVRTALNTLNKLNDQNPNTPGIMGLLARGYMIYGSTGDETRQETPVSYVQLARSTIALDPTNLDALYTLAVTEDDQPPTRRQALQYYQKMIRYHPGRAEVYKWMLFYLEMTDRPCSARKTFFKSIPPGVFSTGEIVKRNELLNACMDSGSESWYSDDYYLTILRTVESNPNQRFLALLYELQLMMGAEQAARETALKIDVPNGGWWVSYAAGYKYLYNQSSAISLKYYIDYFVGINYGTYIHSALFLVYEGIELGDFERATKYLNSLPDFPVVVTNQDSAVGLMMLQHRAGLLEESKHTARALQKSMQEYLLKYPGSYRHYNLAKNHLIAAFYAGELERATEILNTGFDENHAYWRDNIAAVRVLLTPWIQHPLVLEYLNRIELDRQRVRDKFGVQ